jgi:2-desacetyl-2-hydroxyethyl bacteriochlorophyllide A dehydrogenase
MKALRYLGPKQLEVQEVPIPVPGDGEVLIKVLGCGICGSDVHGYLGLTGRRIAPMTMGHEFAGEVAALGSGTGKFTIGEKVVVQPIGFCGECENCKRGLTMLCLNKRFCGVLTVDGAMAEYIAVPEKLLYSQPANCDSYTGALSEPYAVGYGAVKKAGDLNGQNVLIIGAGAIGICILQLVKLQNPNVKKVIVSDLSDARLETALALGADAVINPKNENFMEKINSLTDGHMIDTSIEAVGVQTTANQSIQCLKIAGTTVWVGMSQKEMTINMQDIVCSARNVIGSFNYTHKEFGEVVSLVTSGRMATDKLITKVVSLEEAPKAFEDLHQYPDQYLKIIIDPTK